MGSSSSEEEKNADSAMSSKVVIITGCSSGIGQSLARKLTASFVVIATCRREESVEEWLSDESFTKNGSTSVQLDVASPESVSTAKQQIAGFLKEKDLILWGLVNNAGVALALSPFEMYSPESINWLISINFTGTLNVCQQFIPLMYGRSSKVPPYSPVSGGRIICISSGMANLAFPGWSVYGATKAAISQFAHSLRTELSPRFGIWVSTHEIGSFKTKLNGRQKFTDQFKKVLENIGGNEEITSGYNLEAENDLHEETLDYMMDGGFFQDDLTPVFDDVLHCLTDKKPRRKYTSGTSSMENMLKNTVKKSQSMEWNVTGAGANAIYAKKEESDAK